MEVVASAKRSARKINGVSVDHDRPRDTFHSALPSYRSLYRPLFGLVRWSSSRCRRIRQIRNKEGRDHPVSLTINGTLDR